MDYETFCDSLIKIVGELDEPNEEMYKRFCQATESSHIQVHLGRIDRENFLHPIDISKGAQKILEAINLVQKRGARRGTDYIVACGTNVFGDCFTELHVIGAFLSKEDFV